MRAGTVRAARCRSSRASRCCALTPRCRIPRRPRRPRRPFRRRRRPPPRPRRSAPTTTTSVADHDDDHPPPRRPPRRTTTTTTSAVSCSYTLVAHQREHVGGGGLRAGRHRHAGVVRLDCAVVRELACPSTSSSGNRARVGDVHRGQRTPMVPARTGTLVIAGVTFHRDPRRPPDPADMVAALPTSYCTGGSRCADGDCGHPESG